MRFGLLALVVLSVASCTCGPDGLSRVDPAPLQVTPSAIDFGHVWVGVVVSQPFTVRNPSRASQTVVSSVDAPFVVSGLPDGIAGGSEVQAHVELEATTAGAISGKLWIEDAGVSLSATAEEIPECVPSDDCHVSTFVVDAGACVEALAADGTSCSASFSCFAAAECHTGRCEGRLTTCDDGNPCTGDACGASGCVHYDVSLECAVPANPCRAAICDPASGCTSVDVDDGTPCGARTCSIASVCIGGGCQLRPAPQVQACAETVAGVPAGPGVADGTTLDARFTRVSGMTYSGADLFVSDMADGRARIRRISPDGNVRTIAGGRGAGRVDGFGTTAQLGSHATIIGTDSTGSIVAVDTTTSFAPFSVRRISPAGLVHTVCTDCIGSAAWKLRGDELWLVGLTGPTFAFSTRNVRTGLVRRWTTVEPQDGTPEWVESAEMSFCLQFTADGGFDLVTFVPFDDGGMDVLRVGGGCSRKNSLQRYRADGSVETLAVVGPADDGPVTIDGLSSASTYAAVAFDADGGYALFDAARWHVRRVEGAVIRTLAGPIPRVGRVDGVGADSRLSTPPPAMVTRGNEVLFADGPALRALSAGVVTTLDGDAGVTAFDLAANGSAIWRLETNARVNTYDSSGHWASSFQAPRADARSILANADGGLTYALSSGLYDGGADAVAYASRLRAGTSPVRAYVRAAGNSPRLFYAWLEGQDLLSVFNDPDAGLATMDDFVEESPGVVLGIRGRFVYRLDTVTGQSATLMELSETASSISRAPDGAYVGVSHAILHVRTQ